jgi:hypothetical protein
MNRLGDTLLQIIFVGGLMLIIITFYFTRMAGLHANDQFSGQNNDPYANLVSAYQFEQEENRILTRINILKADYASDLMVYKSEKKKLDQSNNYSTLEKREKLKVLDGLYSKEYFDRKIDLIDQEQAGLEALREAKCLKYCLYEDLPGGS